MHYFNRMSKIKTDCKDILSIKSNDVNVKKMQSECNKKPIVILKADKSNVIKDVANTSRNTFIKVIESVIGGLIIAASLIIAEPIKFWVNSWYWVESQPEYLSQIIVFIILIIIVIIISISLVFFKKRSEVNNR